MPNFPGFPRPRYTALPDLFVDQYMGALNGAEIKVFLYVLRRTRGFHRRTDFMPISQIRQGKPGTSEAGTCLSHGAIRQALDSLCEKGYLRRSGGQGKVAEIGVVWDDGTSLESSEVEETSSSEVASKTSEVALSSSEVALRVRARVPEKDSKEHKEQSPPTPHGGSHLPDSDNTPPEDLLSWIERLFRKNQVRPGFRVSSGRKKQAIREADSPDFRRWLALQAADNQYQPVDLTEEILAHIGYNGGGRSRAFRPSPTFGDRPRQTDGPKPASAYEQRMDRMLNMEKRITNSLTQARARGLR